MQMGNLVWRFLCFLHGYDASVLLSVTCTVNVGKDDEYLTWIGACVIVIPFAFLGAIAFLDTTKISIDNLPGIFMLCAHSIHLHCLSSGSRITRHWAVEDASHLA